MSPLYPVDQVKINNSAGAEAVAVAPEDEIKVLLPNDYDPDQLETEIQLNSESVDAPVREGDVLGSRDGHVRGRGARPDEAAGYRGRCASSEFSSAAAGTGAYIQRNWWKWVVLFIRDRAWGRFWCCSCSCSCASGRSAGCGWKSAAARWRTGAAGSARTMTCRSTRRTTDKGGTHAELGIAAVRVPVLHAVSAVADAAPCRLRRRPTGRGGAVRGRGPRRK